VALAQHVHDVVVPGHHERVHLGGVMHTELAQLRVDVGRAAQVLLFQGDQLGQRGHGHLRRGRRDPTGGVWVVRPRHRGAGRVAEDTPADATPVCPAVCNISAENS
jgi:hypothetical protein